MLKPLAYTYNKVAFRYGLKIWPQEAEDLLDTQPQLAWVRRAYQ